MSVRENAALLAHFQFAFNLACDWWCAQAIKQADNGAPTACTPLASCPVIRQYNLHSVLWRTESEGRIVLSCKRSLAACSGVRAYRLQSCCLVACFSRWRAYRFEALQIHVLRRGRHRYSHRYFKEASSYSSLSVRVLCVCVRVCDARFLFNQPSSPIQVPSLGTRLPSSAATQSPSRKPK